MCIRIHENLFKYFSLTKPELPLMPEQKDKCLKNVIVVDDNKERGWRHSFWLDHEESLF